MSRFQPIDLPSFGEKARHTAQRIPIAAFLAAIVGIGVVFRVAQFMFNRSLWMDESLLALAMRERDFWGLIDPLSLSQAAPIGFLWATRAVTSAFGHDDEYALRLVPLLAGCAAIPMFYFASRKYASQSTAVIATALFAICDRLVYFSSEFKQYSLDATVTVALLWLLPLRSSDRSPLKLLAYAGIGLVALLLSQPAMFILAGFGCGLLIDAIRSRDWRAFACWSAVGLVWAAGLLGLYLVSYRHLSSNAYLLDFWREGFAPFPPTSIWDLEWYLVQPIELLREPVDMYLPGVAMFAVIMGVMSFYRTGPDRWTSLCCIAGLCFIASALGVFPLKGRIVAFLIPLALLLIAEGISYLRLVGRGATTVLSVILLALLSIHSLADCMRALVIPRTIEEIRPVVAEVAARRQRNDAIFLHAAAVVQMRYYGPRFGIRPDEWIEGRDAGPAVETYEADIARVPPGRVWFVFSHISDQRVDVLNLSLQRNGTLLDAVPGRGARAYAYDVPSR